MARLPLLRMLSLAVRQLLRDARAGEPGADAKCDALPV